MINKPDKSILILAFTCGATVLSLLLVVYLGWLPHLLYSSNLAQDGVMTIPSQARLSTYIVQARFAGGVHALETYQSQMGRNTFGHLLKGKLYILIFPLLVLPSLCLIALILYIKDAGCWRSPTLLSRFYFIAALLALGYVEFTFIVIPFVDFTGQIGGDILALFGHDCWVGYVVLPLLTPIWIFLAVMTWASWNYWLARIEITREDRRHRFQFSCLITAAMIIFWVGLRVGCFLYGDDGRNIVQTCGLDENHLPLSTAVIFGYPLNHSQRLTPIRIRFAAADLGSPTGAVYATSENLRRIQNWLNHHPTSAHSDVAYLTLALGHLARWDVDEAYFWLHRASRRILTRAIDIAVLDVGPLKPKRKAILDEWGDTSRWILGPAFQAKLAGQFLRYGDREKGDLLRQKSLASGDTEAKTQWAKWQPSDKTLTTGVIRGAWKKDAVRPIRVGLFRLLGKHGQKANMESAIKSLSYTGLGQFVNLIDSLNLDDNGFWEFKYLREGDYAIGFLFSPENLQAGECVRIGVAPRPLTLSKDHPLLDLGQMQIRSCT